MKQKQIWLFGVLCLFCSVCWSGCAVLYSVQLGEIDGMVEHSDAKFFEIVVSELGLNIDEAAGVAKAFASEGARKEIDGMRDVIGMFQVGPRTGNPVYNEAFADGILDQLKQRCPTGKISNLVSIREAADYPVVSGEIVKITGYCHP